MSAESEFPIRPGIDVNNYKILKKIGAGGMGEVWLAEDTELKRQVALKFLPENLCQDKDCRARFKREAQATAKLKHPNIVTIHEVSEFNGRPFFAMENIEGETLREIIKAGKLTLNDAINFAVQICYGLSEAHDAGIVHRDIKPGNIVIDTENRLCLLDFGLATIKGGEKLTKTGSTMGTIGHMSPEQVRGEEVDYRSDLFSVGVILYEMITGKAPFAEEYDAATMNAILNDTPEPLKRYKSDVPDSLQLVVDKALDKDKETRYQTAAGMLADLKRIKRELEPSGRTSQADIPIKRYSKIFIPLLVVVIALFLLVFKPWKIEISPSQEAIAQENKLAIMYFDNLADPTDSLKLGEITTNLLITDLSESEYVQVVSNQRLYDILKQLGHEGEKKIDHDVATQVAQKANAKWMLLGNILKTEPNIIITARLVEIGTGNVIASQKIEGGQNEDIFPLVDSLTSEIKNDLSLPTKSSVEEDIRIANVTTHSVEAYRYYLEGRDLFHKHYLSEAELSFKKALEHDSTLAMAYYFLAVIDYLFYNKSNAKNWIDTSLHYSDNISKKEKHYIYSLHARLEGDYNLAIDELQKILQINPDEKDAYVTIGLIKYQLMEEPTEAIPYFDKAIELDPYNREAYNQLAYIYNNLGQFEKAIGAINKYIEIAPDESNPYDTKAEIYALNGKLDEAITSYEKANELKPDYSIRSLGDLYLFKQDYAKAESLYQVLASDPNKRTRARGRLALANIPMHQGRFKDALRMLEIGIETDLMEISESATIFKRVSRILIYEAIGDYESAIAENKKDRSLLSKLNLEGPKVSSTGSLASLYLKMGDLIKADSILRQLDKDTDTTDFEILDYYWFVRGTYNFNRSVFDSAVIYFEWTNQITPAFNDQIMIARSYFEIGRLGDAVAMFEKAMKRFEYNRAMFLILSVKAHYYLGQAYEASGWDDKAIEQYETFLDIWKDADEGIEEIEDAKEKLAKLKNKS